MIKQLDYGDLLRDDNHIIENFSLVNVVDKINEIINIIDKQNKLDVDKTSECRYLKRCIGYFKKCGVCGRNKSIKQDFFTIKQDFFIYTKERI